jgi:hypothetical protein
MSQWNEWDVERYIEQCNICLADLAQEIQDLQNNKNYADYRKSRVISALRHQIDQLELEIFCWSDPLERERRIRTIIAFFPQNPKELPEARIETKPKVVI